MDNAKSIGIAALMKRWERLKRPLDQAEDPRVMWKWLYLLIVSVFRILFRLMAHFKVEGRNHLPRRGPYIVASNHISYVDPPVVGAALRQPAYFMAKAELFKVPGFGELIPRIGAFPVHRGAADRAAVRRAQELLKRGEILVIFPEGTRRPVGELGEPEAGFGWIAHRARVPVIPMALIGSADLLPRSAKRLYPSHVTVRVGAPVELDDVWDLPDTREAMKQIGARTMAAIEGLMENG